LKTVVYKNYDAIVNDAKHDVLIEFYAPWCQHCQHLAPTYEKVAESQKANASLTVAKMDLTSNHIPDFPEGFQVMGFPTIAIFPKGNKSNVLLYEGDRTEADLLRFIHGEPVQKPTMEESDEPVGDPLSDDDMAQLIKEEDGDGDDDGDDHEDLDIDGDDGHEHTDAEIEAMLNAELNNIDGDIDDDDEIGGDGDEDDLVLDADESNDLQSEDELLDDEFGDPEGEEDLGEEDLGDAPPMKDPPPFNVLVGKRVHLGGRKLARDAREEL